MQTVFNFLDKHGNESLLDVIAKLRAGESIKEIAPNYKLTPSRLSRILKELSEDTLKQKALEAYLLYLNIRQREIERIVSEIETMQEHESNIIQLREAFER